MATVNQIVDRFCRYKVSDLGTAALERASSVSIQRRTFPGVPGSLACLVSYDTVVAVQVGDLFILNGTRYSVTTSKVQNRARAGAPSKMIREVTESDLFAAIQIASDAARETEGA
jgi:hypothetical protein